MLHQIDPSEKVINEIPKLFKTLKINQLRKKGTSFTTESCFTVFGS